MSKTGLRCDAAAHLGVNTDSADPDEDHGCQAQPETRANKTVGDQIADVDEAADRGENAQRDREEPLHAALVPGLISAETAWSRRGRRSGGVKGSNASLNALARQLNAEFAIEQAAVS